MPTAPDPDPTAAELARVVAWLRARAKVYRAWAKVVEPEERDFNHIRADIVGIIADDLERGEQP